MCDTFFDNGGKYVRYHGNSISGQENGEDFAD